MTEDRLAAAVFFDRFSETFDTLYDGQRGPLMRWLDRNFRSDMYIRFEETFRVFGDLKDRGVLDIGCGSGPYVLEAFHRGAAHVTAVDPAPGMLALVRNRLEIAEFAQRCELVEGLFPGVSLRQHDMVIVMGVMDYVADAAGFLAALRPLVGSKAALSFPSKHWFRTPFRKIRYRLRRCPVYFYDEPQIRDLCRNAGFSRTRVFKIPGAGMDYHVCLQP
jgi:2-polyprenyl-3-methyl-5-hydroxy-6-metoxy-1,4-benzoquinol methylase